MRWISKTYIIYVLPSCLLTGVFFSCNDDALPVVVTGEVSEISGTTATCGGSITSEGSGAVTERGVCWSTKSLPTINDFRTADGSGPGTFISKLFGLEKTTFYYVRAYATNDAGTSYGEVKTFKTNSIDYQWGGQIIADHKIISDFDKIPSFYLNQVKKMMVYFPGESHSVSYREGFKLLESLYPEYKCNISTCEPFTDDHLRVNNGDWTGEADWFTWQAYPVGSRPNSSTKIKDLIGEYKSKTNPISVIGFAWCTDMYEWGDFIGTAADPEYGCRWFGASKGGPQGDRCWGLNAEDFPITDNSVCMDTYLNATLEYIAYCRSNSPETKVVFTTGPVNGSTGEYSYQAQIKNQYIRDFVAKDSSRILFDYADIICYNDDGTTNQQSWFEHSFLWGTPVNIGDESIGHASPTGAIRLAKAQWWLLARIAGWNGE